MNIGDQGSSTAAGDGLVEMAYITLYGKLDHIIPGSNVRCYRVASHCRTVRMVIFQVRSISTESGLGSNNEVGL